MKSETKDNVIIIMFAVLTVFNLFAIVQNFSSCICSVEDTECVEACEQKNMTNHTTCLVVNIISFVGIGALIWLWSKEK